MRTLTRDYRKSDDNKGDRRNGRRLSDEVARLEVKNLLGTIEMAQVKSLPRLKRNEVLRKVKVIDGLSLRQAERILGVSTNLIYKA